MKQTQSLLARATTWVLGASLAALALTAPASASGARVVVLVRGDAQISGADVVHLLSGRAPANATTAQTLTDTDCEPDANGISHCHNELRLANGQTILVRHDHNMRVVPCLRPGETVRVLPAR